MLTLTSKAASALYSVRKETGVPDEFVVRVFPKTTANGLEVQISFASEPADSDQLVRTEGTELFVDENLAEPLADTVIDADQTPQGTELVLRH